MLNYTFKKNKVSSPLYVQLYEFVRTDIMSGRLPADTLLPSKRALSQQLGISVLTVENAYGQLMSEGYIYSRPRRGFFVSDMNPGGYRLNAWQRDAAVSKHAPLPDDVLTRDMAACMTLTDPVFSGEQTTLQEKASTGGKRPGREIIADFSSNSASPDSFPFSVWARLTRQVLSGEQTTLMTNSPSMGLPQLRAAIAAYLRDFRGIDVSPESIVIGAGTEVLHLLLIQLIGAEKVYATENPGYRKLSRLYETYPVKSRRIPIDGSGIIVDELRRHGVDVIHTTPSHHFPTGITMPIGRRLELLGWAGESNMRYIIEDDYDSELRLSGRPIPSLSSIDKSRRVIYMNTFTKTLASTIRISYMVLPPELLERYRERMTFYSCTVSTFEQLTLARFIEGGFYEKHINRMRTAARKKRDLLLKEISSSPLSQISEIHEENAGMHFIIHISAARPDFLQQLAERGVILQPLSWFGEGDSGSYLINYSSVSEATIPEAIHIIAKCASMQHSRTARGSCAPDARR